MFGTTKRDICGEKLPPVKYRKNAELIRGANKNRTRTHRFLSRKLQMSMRVNWDVAPSLTTSYPMSNLEHVHQDSVFFYQGFRVGSRGLVTVPEYCCKPKQCEYLNLVELKSAPCVLEKKGGVVLTMAEDSITHERFTLKKFDKFDESQLDQAMRELRVLLDYDVISQGQYANGVAKGCDGISCTTPLHHIVACRGVYMTDTQLIVVLEPMELGNLANVVATKGALPEPFMSLVARQCISAVSALHAHGWSHNAVTMDALWLMRDGRVVLGDFEDATLHGELARVGPSEADISRPASARPTTNVSGARGHLPTVQMVQEKMASGFVLSTPGAVRTTTGTGGVGAYFGSSVAATGPATTPHPPTNANPRPGQSRGTARPLTVGPSEPTQHGTGDTMTTGGFSMGAFSKKRQSMSQKERRRASTRDGYRSATSPKNKRVGKGSGKTDSSPALEGWTSVDEPSTTDKNHSKPIANAFPSPNHHLALVSPGGLGEVPDLNATPSPSGSRPTSPGGKAASRPSFDGSDGAKQPSMSPRKSEDGDNNAFSCSVSGDEHVDVDDGHSGESRSRPSSSGAQRPPIGVNPSQFASHPGTLSLGGGRPSNVNVVGPVVIGSPGRKLSTTVGRPTSSGFGSPEVGTSGEMYTSRRGRRRIKEPTVDPAEVFAQLLREESDAQKLAFSTDDQAVASMLMQLGWAVDVDPQDVITSEINHELTNANTTSQMVPFLQALNTVKGEMPQYIKEHAFITSYKYLSSPTLAQWLRLGQNAGDRFARLLRTDGKPAPVCNAVKTAYASRVLMAQSQIMTDADIDRLHRTFSHYAEGGVEGASLPNKPSDGQLLTLDGLHLLLSELGEIYTKDEIERGVHFVHQKFGQGGDSTDMTFALFLRWWSACNFFRKFEALP